MRAGFEGSYAGDDTQLNDDAQLECKICWWVYDPAEGDETRQIPPGTPFSALPADWVCPNCDGDKAQFMLLDPGTPTPAPPARFEKPCRRRRKRPFGKSTTPSSATRLW